MPDIPSPALPSASPLKYRIAARTAVVAGLFSAIVCFVMLYDFSRRESRNPSESRVLKALKAAVVELPDNKALKEEYRMQDFLARREHFRQRAFAHAGAMLLGIGIAIFLIAMKVAGTLGRSLPQPKAAATQDWESQWTPLARLVIGGMLVLLAGVSVGLSAHWTSPLPNDDSTELAAAVSARPAGEGTGKPASPSPAQTSAPEKPVAVTPAPTKPTNPEPAPKKPAPEKSTQVAVVPPPAPDRIEKLPVDKTWPCFRGPGGSGISAFTNLPETWDGASGKNIAWKTPVPLPGHNSPVVCNGRVFLSGADEKERKVYCFDAVSGKLLWTGDVPSTPASLKPIKMSDETGFAASTVATDGRYVAAIFANGDLAAFDYDGKLAWSKSLGIPENAYGHGASLSVYKHSLIVPFDQATVTAGRSKVMVYDFATGNVVWEKSRPVPSSWTTPIVVHFQDRDQLVTFSSAWVIGYDMKDGAEIWRAKYQATDAAPSPVAYGGVAYVACSPGDLRAIGIYGKGDVSESHVLWKGEDNLPDICSPVVVDCFIYLLSSEGMVTCYDTKTGEKLWEVDLEKPRFKASPSLVGNKLWLFDEEGKAWFLEPTREKCTKLAGNPALGEACTTSPAFQDGCFYVRGAKNLFCVGVSPRPQGEGQGVKASAASVSKP